MKEGIKMGVLNILAAAATFAALGFALWQYHQLRRKEQTEHERVSLQRERIRSAKAAAAAGADTSNLIVQRAKDPSVQITELQNVARVLRANLRLLVRQLSDEEDLLSNWEFGQLLMSSPPDKGP